MALKYDVQYKHTAIIGGKEIKFRPWNTKDEKDYLIATESKDVVTDEELFELLVRPCLENPNISLTPNEKKLLMIEIRKKSIGPEFPVRYKCIKCKQVNEIQVPFDKVVKYTESNFRSIKKENLVFNFTENMSESLKARRDNEENKIEKAFIDFLIHIKSIEIDGRLEDMFTFDELREFVESLPSYIFDDVFAQFQEMKGSLTFELTTYCAMCNTENKIDFNEGLPGFLWG